MRLKNIFRNSFFSLLSQFALILIGFFSQRVMNLTMGEELVGMNSVISNIVAILSVSELGIASAIVFHLYKALAEQDEKKIASLMNLYQKAYYIFAAAIICMGLCIMPFVHLFLKDSRFSISYIRTIYFLWLARTALSYLLSCKRSILIADQKEYIVSIATLIINVLNYGAIIIILILWKNYQLALTLNIIIETALNLRMIQYVNKKYPFLKQYRKTPLERTITKTIFGEIKNIFISRLSSKLLVSTDNLIISSFISVAITGRYANYSLITQSVSNIMLALSQAAQPSIGNLFTEKKQEKNYQVLRQVTFVFFLLASFCAAGMMSLMSIFVTDFWLAGRYRLSTETVICCVVNCYLFIIGLPIAMMMSASGMFSKERNISVFYAAANLVISLLLVKPLGIIGVLLGTSASYLIQVIFRIRAFFRDSLCRSSRHYLSDLLQYTILSVSETAAACFFVNWFYQGKSLPAFLLSGFFCAILPNLVNYLIFRKSWRMGSILHMIISYSKKIKYNS